MNDLNKIENAKLLELHKILKEYVKELDEKIQKGES